MIFTILGSTFSQPEPNSLIPKIDERVELLSIAFRLSGMEELNDTLNNRYSEAIDKHFGKFSNHKLIVYLRNLWDKLKKENVEFGYWDAPAIAIHLSQPPGLKPLVPLTDSTNNDPWDNRALLTDELIELLKKFYIEADCESFFKSQEGYYNEIYKQYNKDEIKLNKKWLIDFYSIEPSEKYYAVIALCLRNGAYLRVNYGNEIRDTYTIFGCAAFDDKGIPATFKEQYFPLTILHEYIHCFVNQLVERNSSKLKKPAEVIISNPKVFELMKDTFYGNWRYLLYESIVRANSISYTKANTKDKNVIEKDYEFQEKAGFFWMRDLVKEFDKYEASRDEYKNMEQFMPVIVKFFTRLAEEYK